MTDGHKKDCNLFIKVFGDYNKPKPLVHPCITQVIVQMYNIIKLI